MAVKLLDAIDVIAISPTWTVRMKPRNHTIHLVTLGVPTAVTVDLEGSSNGVDWSSLAEHVMSAEELTAETAIFHVVNKLIRYIRVNATLLTGDAQTRLTAYYEGEGA